MVRIYGCAHEWRGPCADTRGKIAVYPTHQCIEQDATPSAHGRWHVCACGATIAVDDLENVT